MSPRCFIALLLVALAVAGPASFGNSRQAIGTDRVLRLFWPDSPLSEEAAARARTLLGEADVWGHAEDGGLEARVTVTQAAGLAKLGLNYTDVTDHHLNHFDWMAKNDQLCTGDIKECLANFYTQYQSYDAIHAYLESLRAAHTDLITNLNWGTSYEGRDQKGVIVSGFGGAEKPVVFYFCGQHAREWLPPMFCVYMVEKLVQGYGSDPDVTKMMDTYQFHVLPVMNPDGYIFSQNSNNMWRKSRKPNSGSSCIGTDLNRNWEYQWATGGSSSNPCSETYHGVDPFDSIETKNIFDYAQKYVGQISVFMDVHAYGQMWMHAWGYTTALPPDNTRQQQCGDASGAAIQSINGLRFAVGTIARVIYVASGASVDQMYGAHKVVFSYTPEVRGSSFQPPASNIVPSNAELWAGFVAQMNCVSFFEENPEAEVYVK